jgi:methylmalonyl-CoA/ethylmalonyl-CoA epimerase
MAFLPNSPLGSATIGQIGVTITDVERSIRFYRDVLGMKLLFDVPNMAFFSCDTIRLMLSVAERPEDHFGSAIYFKVPDIQQSFQALSERGASFDGPPHVIARMATYNLWMAFFRDPDLNLLALMCEIPRG